MVETTVLAGMAQIRRIIPRSEATILDLKRKYPAMPIHREADNGEWLSDSEELLTWWRMYVKGKAHLYEAGEPAEDKEPDPDTGKGNADDKGQADEGQEGEAGGDEGKEEGGKKEKKKGANKQ